MVSLPPKVAALPLASGDRRQEWAQTSGVLGAWARRTGERQELRGPGGPTRPVCWKCNKQDTVAARGRYDIGPKGGQFYCGDCWKRWGPQLHSAQDYSSLNKLSGQSSSSTSTGRLPLRPEEPWSGSVGLARAFLFVGPYASDGLAEHYRSKARSPQTQTDPALRTAFESLAGAQDSLLAGDFGSASTAAAAALAILRGRSGQLLDATYAVRALLRSRLGEGDFAGASQLLEREREDLRSGPQSAEKGASSALLLLSFSEILVARGHLSLALARARGAEDELQRSKELRGAALAKLLVSKLELAFGNNVALAVEEADRAFALFDELGEETGKANSLSVLASALRAATAAEAQQKRPEGEEKPDDETSPAALAKKTSEAAIAFYQAQGNIVGEASELLACASDALTMGEAGLAVEMADNAASIGRQTWHSLLESWALQVSTEARIRLGELRAAEDWLQEAQASSAAAGDALREAFAKASAATLKVEQRRFGDALTSLKEAAAVFLQLGNLLMASAMENNAARILLLCGRPADAVKEAKHAASLCSDGEGLALAVAAAQWTLARAKSDLGEYEEALPAAAESVQLYRGLGHLALVGRVSLEVAFLRGKLEQRELAQHEASKAKQLLQEAKDFTGEAGAWLLLCELHILARKASAAKWALENVERLRELSAEQDFFQKEVARLQPLVKALEETQEQDPFASVGKFVKEERVHRSYLQMEAAPGPATTPTAAVAPTKAQASPAEQAAAQPSDTLLAQRLGGEALVSVCHLEPSVFSEFSRAAEHMEEALRSVSPSSSSAGKRCEVCGQSLKRVGLLERVSQEAGGGLEMASCSERDCALRVAAGAALLRAGLEATTPPARRAVCLSATLQLALPSVQGLSLPWMAAVEGHRAGLEDLAIQQLERCLDSDDADEAVELALEWLSEGRFNDEKVVSNSSTSSFGWAHWIMLLFSSPSAGHNLTLSKLAASMKLPTMLVTAAEGQKAPSLSALREALKALSEIPGLDATTDWFLERESGQFRAATPPQHFQSKLWGLAGIVKSAISKDLQTLQPARPGEGELASWRIRPMLFPGQATPRIFKCFVVLSGRLGSPNLYRFRRLLTAAFGEEQSSRDALELFAKAASARWECWAQDQQDVDVSELLHAMLQSWRQRMFAFQGLGKEEHVVTLASVDFALLALKKGGEPCVWPLSVELCPRTACFAELKTLESISPDFWLASLGIDRSHLEGLSDPDKPTLWSGFCEPLLQSVMTLLSGRDLKLTSTVSASELELVEVAGGEG